MRFVSFLRGRSVRRGTGPFHATRPGSPGILATPRPLSSGRSGAFPLEQAPPRGSARGTSTSETTSPFTRTPPWAMSLRASLVEPIPSDSASSAGRWTGSPSGSGTSGTSSGAWRSRTTRVKCSSAALAASSPCDRGDDEPCKGELRLERVAVRRRLFQHELVPLRQLIVGDPHRPPELLLGRHRQRDVVAERRGHLLAVPAQQKRRGQDDLRLEAVRLHDLAPCEQVVELVVPPSSTSASTATES